MHKIGSDLFKIDFKVVQSPNYSQPLETTKQMPNPNRIGQRFIEGDRVSKRRIDGFNTNRPKRTGNVVEVVEEMKKIKNKNPFKHYSYKVLWDDLKSPSLHAQQTLQALDD